MAMSMKRVSMKKIKEILRLKFESKLSHRAIARSLGVSASTVCQYTTAFLRKNLEWPLAPELDDNAIQELLESTPFAKPGRNLVSLDCVQIHQELKKKGVTLQLLWEEYKEVHGVNGYSRTQYCDIYRAWVKKLNITMRQSHKSGEKLFIDYCGPTVPIYVFGTGEIREAQIFVAVLGASNYTYAEATWTQSLPDWVGSHTRAFSFFGGVPELLIPDNLRSAVSKACRYEPDKNPTYADMVSHYGTAVMPARPYKPRDKAKVEVGVQIVERWILARLRNHKFFSLYELNETIKSLLKELNARPFKKLPGSRLSQFEVIDKLFLKPLPKTPYTYAEFKKAKLGVDYHIEVDSHYYSAPYQLAKETVEIRITANTIEIFHKNKRVASHLRSYRKGKHTTLPEHMPTRHKKHMEWTPGRLLNWAQSVGSKTLELTQGIINSKDHPEIAYRACLGLLNLSKKFGNERLENACARAIFYQTPKRHSVLAILNKGLDKQPLPERQEKHKNLLHENVRGPNYFISTT